MKLKSFQPTKIIIQIEIVLVFVFESLNDAENAVSYAKTFNPVPKLNMKWNRDSTKNDFEDSLGHVKASNGPYSSVTFMLELTLAN